MFRSTTPPPCRGCYPVYQENQLAHTEDGGCMCLDLTDELDSEFQEVTQTETCSVSSVSDKPGNIECCICYDTINTEKNNCVTECGHQFCFKCLATSMVHNGCTCPCCRSPLVEMSSDDEDSDEDGEGEDGDDEDGDEDDNSENNEQDEDAFGDENEVECDIEELTRRLKANGFKMQDMLSMLLGRYIKGSSDAAVYELNKKFDTIVDDADSEAVEQEAMGLEDKRM